MANDIETAFKLALEQNLSRFSPSVSPAKAGELAACGPVDTVLLSISSMAFRLVACLSFPSSEASRSFLSEAFGVPFEDAYCEMGNMVCGQVNRCLSQTFRFSGISTPLVFESEAMTGMLEQQKWATQTYWKTPLDEASGCSVQLSAYCWTQGGAALAFDPLAGSSAASQASGGIEGFGDGAEHGGLELF